MLVFSMVQVYSIVSSFLELDEDIVVDGEAWIPGAIEADPDAAYQDFLEEAFYLVSVLRFAEVLQAILTDPVSVPEPASRRVAASTAFAHSLLHGQSPFNTTIITKVYPVVNRFFHI